MSLGHGLHLSLPLADYLADPCQEPSLSPSIAHLLDTRSPAHARLAHPRLTSDASARGSVAFDVGSAVHTVLFEDAARIVVVDARDYKTKQARIERDQARVAKKIPILVDRWRVVQAMADAVRQAIPFPQGAPEVTMLWRTPESWCRARPDWYTEDRRDVLDLKTTSASAHPLDYTRTLFNTGADLQAAAYRAGGRAVSQITPDVTFIVVEDTPPYAVSLMSLDHEALAFADQRWQRAVETWGACLERGVFPGYPQRIAYVEVPPWLRTTFELRGYYTDEHR